MFVYCFDFILFVIELNDVVFCWLGVSLFILDIVYLQIVWGEYLFVKGFSGCGKFMLFSFLTGINIVI